jgi:hypothetical protein
MSATRRLGRTFATMRLAPVVAVIAVLGMTAAPAHADQGSALDQYLEDVPGAGDDRSTNDTITGGSVPLDPPAAQALQQFGQRGERTQALAEQTRPEPPAQNGNDQTKKDEEGDDGGGGVGTVAVSLLDPAGGGIGLALPLILIGTLIAGIAFAISRRSRTPAA